MKNYNFIKYFPCFYVHQIAYTYFSGTKFKREYMKIKEK